MKYEHLNHSWHQDMKPILKIPPSGKLPALYFMQNIVMIKKHILTLFLCEMLETEKLGVFEIGIFAIVIPKIFLF